MENVNVLSQFNFNYKEIVIDEVALEGLEGITLELLWKRVEKRISRNLTNKIYSFLWKYLLSCDGISLYSLPEPRKCIELRDRTSIVQEDGLLCDPLDYLDGPYEYHPNTTECGSCKDYDTRIHKCKEECKKLSYETVVNKYGNSLVLVASKQLRWKALVPHIPEKILETLSPVQYCILELIGKSRNNGQATIGKTNLLKITNNAKLFYVKKILTKLDLIQPIRMMQVLGTRSLKCYVIMLKRFAVPAVFMTPTQGPMVDVIAHLKTRPNFSDTLENLKKLHVLLPNNRKMYKKYSSFLGYEKIKLDDVDEQPPAKKKRRSPPETKVLRLEIDSDAETNSDEDLEIVTVPNEYKVGVNIYRQVYELIKSSENKGISSVELRKKLRIGYYTSRQILKYLVKKDVIKEFFVDYGRQRVGRYVLANVPGLLMDIDVEKKKFADNFHNLSTAMSDMETSFDETNTSITPNTSICDENTTTEQEELASFHKNVSEVDVSDKDSAYQELVIVARNTTMRQLKFANSIIKIIQDKQIIYGMKNLNSMAAEMINESDMDSKNFKNFAYKLAKDGFFKFINVNWPSGSGVTPQSSMFICAPHIKIDHPVIRAKFKEIFLRAHSKGRKKPSPDEEIDEHTPNTEVEQIVGETKNEDKKSIKKLKGYSFQRYRRIQSFHEFIFKFVRLENRGLDHGFEPGFASIGSAIPDMTVELALGNFSEMTISNLQNLNLNETLLKTKLKDAPAHVYKALVGSKHLQKTVMDNIHVLATLGLIQLFNSKGTLNSKGTTYDHHSGCLKYILYVNSNAKILDTRGEWPRNVDLASLELNFNFQSYQDVQEYWKRVYDIAMETKITKRLRKKSLPTVPVRTQDQAAIFDAGHIYGDRNGACGFDSIFCIDLAHNWASYTNEMIEKSDIVPPWKKKNKPSMKKKKAQVKAVKPICDPIARNRQPNKKPGEKRKRAKVNKDPNLLWSPWEDEILTLCMAAYVILCPVTIPGGLSARNSVAKHLINKPVRTSGNIHKRIKCIENEALQKHKVECLVSEIRRRKSVLEKYEGLYRKIRHRNSSNDSQYCREAELATFELVWMLYNISKSKSFLERTPCVANSIEEFYHMYDIKTAKDNKTVTLYNSINDLPAVVQTLKEAVLMAMTSAEGMVMPSQSSGKIYNSLWTYDEAHIRSAVDQLRNAAVIAVKDKYLQSQLTKFTFQDLIRVTSCYMKAMSAFKLAAVYKRKLLCRINSGFTGDLAKIITKNTDVKKLEGSPGLNCFTFEMHSTGVVDVVRASPPYIDEISAGNSTLDDVTSTEENYRGHVKPGKVEFRMTEKVESITQLFGEIDFDAVFQTLFEMNIVRKNHGPPPNNDKILNYLKDVGTTGATFYDLQKIWTSDRKSLIKKLQRLEKENFIIQVGYTENFLVLTENVEPWCIKIEDKDLIPAPWITGELTVNKDFLLKWCVVIVSKIFEFPGIPISTMSQQVEVLAPRYLQHCCEFLAAIKCVKLKNVYAGQVDLFSEEYSDSEFDDYCKYASPDCIVLFPVPDILTRFSYYKSVILKQT